MFLLVHAGIKLLTFALGRVVLERNSGFYLVLLNRTMPGIISWAALLAFAAAMMSSRAQPVGCFSDEQCSAGYFCHIQTITHIGTNTNICQDCLHCEEDFKREAPAFPTPCVKSEAKCGPCLQGLVLDGSHLCAPPDAGSAGALPVKIWFIIGFVILGVFIAMVIVILFARKKKDLFRISTATWLRSSCGPEGPASAPEPPPPYNPYSPVRPDSPFSVPDVNYSPPLTDLESSAPFIKRAPAPLPSRAREAAGNQNARVFNPPSYVRIDPQSPITPLAEDDSAPWPAIHSEDTTPHDWTPDTSTNDDNGNPSGSEAGAAVSEVALSESSSNLPALLAAARETTLVAPPAKKLKTQDNNNNGNRGASSAEGEAPAGLRCAARATDAPSIYLNIVQINNTKL